MRHWWRRRSLRVRLAAWYAATGALVWVVCLLGLAAGRFWRPPGAELSLTAPLGGLGSLLLCGLGGYFIAGRALAPVKEMVERTRRVSSKALSERLPVANPHDELGELATVFNTTLQQLEDAFAELRRFTGDVSHELRTPLTAMRAVGEVALREHNSAILYDALGSMLEEIRRMNQMVERLLLLGVVRYKDMMKDVRIDLPH